MKTSLSTDVEIPVMVVLIEDPVAVVPAVLLRLEPAELSLRLDTAGASVGERVVAAAGSTTLPGRITAIDGPILTVTRTGLHGSDDRAAPRVKAPVQLAWWTDGDPAAWLAGAAATGPRRVASGDDVSLSGVRFTVAAEPPVVGDRLMLEAEINPGQAPHRLVAVVRRCWASVGEWTVAVSFVEMDEATAEALLDLTLQKL
jgi:hypothetical protein